MLSEELRQPSEAISTAIYDWLAAEVETSSQSGDVNEVLNDYSRARAGLRGGFDHKDNFPWQKVQAHANRLALDMEAFATTPPSDNYFDKIASKIVFDGLMEVSGTYRIQCYFQATDPENYLERRRQVVGIDIGMSAVDRLVALVPSNGDFSASKITPESLAARSKEVAELGITAVKRVCSRAALEYDLGVPHSRSVEEMASAQYHWLNFSLDALLLIAKQKDGDLAAVPFLEPRSITEQSGQLHYPLAAPVNWAELLAA